MRELPAPASPRRASAPGDSVHLSRAAGHLRARAGLIALAGAILALCGGCTSTQERSARMEREAKAHVHSIGATAAVISRPSQLVKPLEAVLLTGSESDAIAVRLRNYSASALSAVPIAVSVLSAEKHVLYRNDTPGLAASLTAIALLRPHEETVWVDDQVQLAGAGAAVAPKGSSVTALIGEGQRLPDSGALPQLSLESVHGEQTAELGEATAGAVDNRSGVAQSSLVIYGAARRNGRIVAAGRAQVPSLAAGERRSFQLFMVGNAHGAQSLLSVPPMQLK